MTFQPPSHTKMSKQHKRVNKGQKVLVADINVPSKVSKLSYFCGCFFILLYSGWISSSFVAADIHTYGPHDFKGLLLTFPFNLTIFFFFIFKVDFHLIHISGKKRRSDFKSSNFRTKHNRTNKLYGAI